MTEEQDEILAKAMAQTAVSGEVIKTIKTTEFLRYHFTDEEKTKLAQEMAQSVINGRDLEEQKKAVVSQYSSQINEAVAKSNSAAQKIESGFEMRTIDCEEHYIYGENIVRTIRLDNMEIVKERTMTSAELQQEMFGEEKGG